MYGLPLNKQKKNGLGIEIKQQPKYFIKHIKKPTEKCHTKSIKTPFIPKAYQKLFLPLEDIQIICTHTPHTNEV